MQITSTHSQFSVYFITNTSLPMFNDNIEDESHLGNFLKFTYEFVRDLNWLFLSNEIVK